jgi:hypothetical protein
MHRQIWPSSLPYLWQRIRRRSSRISNISWHQSSAEYALAASLECYVMLDAVVTIGWWSEYAFSSSSSVNSPTADLSGFAGLSLAVQEMEGEFVINSFGHAVEKEEFICNTGGWD